MAFSLPREMPFPFLTLPPRAGSQPSKQASKGNAGHGAPASPRSPPQQPPCQGTLCPGAAGASLRRRGGGVESVHALARHRAGGKNQLRVPTSGCAGRKKKTSRSWPYSRRWGELRRRPARPRCPAWLPGLVSRRLLASLTFQGLAQLGSSRHDGSSYPPHPAGCEPRQQAGYAQAFTLPDAAAGTPFATKQEISSVLPRLPACLPLCAAEIQRRCQRSRGAACCRRGAVAAAAADTLPARPGKKAPGEQQQPFRTCVRIARKRLHRQREAGPTSKAHWKRAGFSLITRRC